MIAYVFLFKRKITPEFFFPLFQTNIVEIVEFLSGTISFSLWLYVILFAVVLWYIQRNTLVFLGAKQTCILGGLGISLFITLLAINAQRHLILYTMYRDAQKIYYTAPSLYTIHREANMKTVQSEVLSTSGLYVVVIGESATSVALGAYGYYRDTTPFLSSNIANPKYIIAHNVYAPEIFTEQSVFYMLTNSNQYSVRNEQSVLSILDILRTAGVKTIWVSNQGMVDVNSAQVRSISSKADVIFSDIGGNVHAQHYDEALLPHIAKLLEKETSNGTTVLFVHIYGSHINYCRRYDRNKYNIFTDTPQYSFHTKYNVINCYDNSIYATDAFLRSLTAMVEHRPDFKMLVYLSDHGEGAYRGKTRGHSECMPDVIRVPLYFYMSEQYIKEHKERVMRLQKNADRGYSTDMLFDTLLGLFDIKTNWYQAQYDLSSPAYTYTYEDIKTLSGKAYVKDILKGKIPTQ